MAALRTLLLQVRAAARRRGALAASRAAQARACARARGRAIRAEAEVATSAVVACAEARARAVRAFLLRAQRQVGVAAAVTGLRLRQASDSTVGTFLWAAYGESAPRTPSPEELVAKLMLVIERAKEIENMVTLGFHARQVFDNLSPWDFAFIMTILCRAVDELYKNVIPSAPETSCPFLGVRSLEFDEFPVEEGLAAVMSLSVRFAGVVMLYAGGLCICFCRDIGVLVVGMVGRNCYEIAAWDGDVWEFSEAESASDEWAMF